MTKKHFIEIAATIKALHGLVGADTATLNAVATKLAAVFKEANPRFDKARFLAACGF